ncbi:MAG: transcription-repair coupling factor [Bernardetiaceae bacterium]|nr:transcription-repair coupling factor [Bernardetiaceae bacterium]
MQEETLIAEFSIDTLITPYYTHSMFAVLCREVTKKNQAPIHIQGLKGSVDALLLRNIATHHPEQSHLLILEDKEEAAYFYQDMQNLFEENHKTVQPRVLFFPASYKKPYQIEQTDNANVLQRAEVLNQINQIERTGKIIVTYPAALTEKVLNKRSLLGHTFTVHVGEKLDFDTLEQILIEYDYKKGDFAYEAGQYAIRGGIIDIFSFANEYPFRIELWGDDIDNIRTFDPNTQLSQHKVDKIAIVPNINSKLQTEQRDSFLEFIPKQSNIWLKNEAAVIEIIKKYFEKAEAQYQKIAEESNETTLVTPPELRFQAHKDFKQKLYDFKRIYFGSQIPKNLDVEVITWKTEPQPTFQKDFAKLIEHIAWQQQNGYEVFICADAPNQLDRIRQIFEQINPNLDFNGLILGLRNGFVDPQTRIACYTDHQIFERYQGVKTGERFSKSKALTLKELNSLQVGDYVTHIDYGVGRFAGLEKIDNNGREQEAVRLIYRDNDLLYVSIHALHKISRYSGKDAVAPSLNKLGSPEWDNKKKKVRKKLKDIGTELIELYAKRQATPGFAFSPDSYLQAHLESSFMYQDTPDQALATAAVKADMEKPYPMDRLVCGDVGFGKTEIAIRAAFKAVADGKQVAVLVPTTILAAQHYRTFAERMSELPCRVDYINRFRTAAEVRNILKDLEEGKIDILIGTHKIIGKSVKFKDLGLMIIDEEQKFGVRTKDKLKAFRVNVDCLTLTATPIPRTLQFSLLGARDLSMMHTPPPNRQPVTTEIHSFNEEVLRDAISYELQRGGQVFFVHNRISDIFEIANIIARLVPDAKISVAHGQMKDNLLEKTMMDFVNGKNDILVSTNIIESGLDIPNANTIIINRAHMFGLSDLHQMRGRVGRSNQKAFCYLIIPSLVGLPADARKRLKAMEEFTELGDGFKIAMRDLDIRGAGNLLGAEQSGFINDLGLEAYQQMLEETIAELKEKDFKELFQREIDTEKFKVECNIETDLEIRIPESYIANISERLNLYIQADRLKSEQELLTFKQQLKDRFGAFPPAVEEWLETVELRWLAEKVGIEKLILKNEKLKAYCITGQEAYIKSAVFGNLIKYVGERPKRCELKEINNQLLFKMANVKTVNGASTVLKAILEG